MTMGILLCQQRRQRRLLVLLVLVTLIAILCGSLNVVVAGDEIETTVRCCFLGHIGLIVLGLRHHCRCLDIEYDVLGYERSFSFLHLFLLNVFTIQ